MNYYSLIPLSSSVFHCIIGAYTLATNPRGKTNRAFAKYTAIVALWAAFDFFIWNLKPDNTALILMRIQIITWLPAGLFVYYFISVIVRKKTGPLFYIISGIIIIISIAGMFTDFIAENISETYWGIILVPGKFHFPVILLCNTSVIIYSIYILIINYIKTRDRILKNQLFYLSVGTTITYTFVFFINVIANQVFYLKTIPAMGTFFMLIQALFVSIAIVKYNFLRVGVKETVNELFTQVNDAVIIFDPDGKVLQINNKALDFFGINKKGNLVYRDIFPEEFIYEQKYFNKQITLKLNSDIRYGLLSQSTLSEKKIILGKLVIIRDVTLLREKEIEREQLKEQVRQSHTVKMEAVGQLAGGIAHDFNNMLTGISGYADLIKRESLKYSQKLYRYGERIISTIERASDLTKQLLAFARKGKYEIVALDTHRVIKDVITLLKHSIDKRIIIKEELIAENQIIKGDLTQIENAILNIGLNARDAMVGGGILKFKTENVNFTENYADRSFQGSRPGDYILISISDTGCGMTDEVKDRIFEPFFTTKDKGKGTGLGLASVYGTIENHNGFINVDSVINFGTTFNVYFPYTTEVVNENKVKNISESDLNTDGIVLIVDDEQIALDSSADMLSALGFNVIPRNNGYDGIDIYEKLMDQICFIILDLNMPGINGHDCLNRLRQINTDVKVIIVSGYYQDEEVEKISGERNLVFLKKPFTIDQLTSSIFRIQGMGLS